MKERILKLLKGADGYLSGEKLSRELGITRTAIWKWIAKLKQEGYAITSVTNRGYRLENASAYLSNERISKGLDTEFIGKSLYIHEEVTSTNDVAKELAASGAPDGSAVLAERQTAGKGRLGRQWSSDSLNSIFLSLLLYPNARPQDIMQLPLTAGLSVCTVLRRETGLDVQIKWPNDVIINGKKVCGILAEMGAEAEHIHYAVLGIGINTNTGEFPAEISHKATSLFLETKQQFDRNRLTAEILNSFEGYYQTFCGQDGLAEIIRQYKPLCATLHKRVSVLEGGPQSEALAKDILPDGSLLIQTDDGEERAVQAGEVSVRGIYGYV